MKKMKLDEINLRCKADPVEFIQESEQHYHDTIRSVAEDISKNHKEHPILLLNGPSSSGKTTTARFLRDELERMGIHSHAISMDDYYQTREGFDMPVDEEGMVDLESPLCMDLPLLSSHLMSLAKGEEIEVPHYDFAAKRRTEDRVPVRLEKGEVAVIEGIHALNEVIMQPLKQYSTGVYMAVGTEVVVSKSFRLAPHKLRFIRRAIRDDKFRDETVMATIRQWRSVRRGEKLYIHPYVPNAARIINTYLPYEDNVLMNLLRKQAVHYENELKAASLEEIFRALDLFEPIEDLSLLPKETIIREFVG